jgi:hypothetical protein
MMSNVSGGWLLAVWFAVVSLTVVGSVAMGAGISTSALLLLMGVAPAVVMLLIGAGAPSPTVAEILYSVNTRDGRQ